MNIKKILFIGTLLYSTISFAQGWDPEPDPGFGGGKGDPATEPIELPIDSIEFPLLITGFILALIIIRRKQKQSVKLL
ncbi:MAG: hypothetical protein I4O51_05390 [Flavobacterium micromati]|nr:hypothetical protein [Flavobacterium micromati]